MSHSYEREAELLYRAIFDQPAPPVVVERFAGAAALLDAGAAAPDIEAYRLALERVGDLEALEVAARYRGRLPLLVRKFRLMVYLAEAVPDNQRFFVKRRPGRLGAVASVAGGLLRTAIQLARGLVLLSRVKHG
jgi:hypothetical protein